MPAVQSSYATTLPVGFPGMVANSETDNRITRSAGGNIGFGLPVIRVGDHGCILASQETLESAGATANAGNTGNGAFGAITVSSGAKEGTYKVNITAAAANAGTFVVEDPDGNIVGYGTVAVAFSKGGIAFTLADGATDFVVGDGFTFPVTPSVATADLDVLGIAIRNTVLVHDTADRYEQYDNVAILVLGVIWVTCGATVAAGDPVYWNPATSRFTNTTTHLRIPGFVFDIAGVNGDIVKIARR